MRRKRKVPNLTRACIVYCVHVCISKLHPPPTGAWLSLAVEVDGGDRRSEVIELREVPGVEVLPPPGGIHSLPAGELPEKHEDVAVDAELRPRALVAHYLLTCSQWVLHACMAVRPISARVRESRMQRGIWSCSAWRDLTVCCFGLRGDVGDQPAAVEGSKTSLFRWDFSEKSSHKN